MFKRNDSMSHYFETSADRWAQRVSFDAMIQFAITLRTQLTDVSLAVSFALMIQ
jgi:hypothetical protein